MFMVFLAASTRCCPLHGQNDISSAPPSHTGARSRRELIGRVRNTLILRTRPSAP